MTALTQRMPRRRHSGVRWKLFLTAAIVSVASLLAAACGDDEPASSAPETATATPETTAAAPETTAATPEEATGAAACAPGETDGDLTFYNWAEYIDEELLTAFEDETGINVQYTTYESNEEMLTKVESGAAIFDLIVPSDYMVDTMRREGLLLELNYDAIPNSANIGDEFANPPFDPEHKHHVAYQWGTTGIGMSYDVLDLLGGESTWAVIFDPATAALVPGSISMLDDAPETVSAALKYLGYSIEDVINERNEDAVREAGELLRATNERLLKYDLRRRPGQRRGGRGSRLERRVRPVDLRGRRLRDPRLHHPQGGRSPLGGHHGHPAQRRQRVLGPRHDQLPDRRGERRHAHQLDVLRQPQRGGHALHPGRDPGGSGHLPTA